MLRIYREGNDIKVHIKYKTLNWSHTLTIPQGNELDAELRKNDLATNMHETIETIRRQEYEQGYKDAKAKKAKKKYFDCGWYVKEE